MRLSSALLGTASRVLFCMASCQSCGMAPWPEASFALLVRTVTPTTMKALRSSIFGAPDAVGADAVCDGAGVAGVWASPVAAMAKARGRISFAEVRKPGKNIGEQYTQADRASASGKTSFRGTVTGPVL